MPMAVVYATSYWLSPHWSFSDLLLRLSPRPRRIGFFVCIPPEDGLTYIYLPRLVVCRLADFYPSNQLGTYPC